MNADRVRCRLFGHKPFPMEPVTEGEVNICVRCGEIDV